MQARFLGIFLLIHSAIFALYMGNPAEPEIIDAGLFIPQDASFSVKVGYQGDRVFDRLLHAYAGSHARVDRFEMQTDQGVITLNYLDRFELYGTVGSMRSCFWFRPHVDKKRREFETNNRATGSIGARLLLAQWGNTGIGLDGKIQYGKPGIRWVAVNGVSHTSSAHLTYREWQGSLGVYHTIDLFTPYLGVKYSNVHADVQGLSKSAYPHQHFKMSNRCRFGMAVGCSVSQGKKVDLNLEVQLIDEQALTWSGNIKF